MLNTGFPVGTSASISPRPARESVYCPGVQSRSLKSNRNFLLILVLIFASGAAALIYEMVWFQMLQLITGSSALAIAILLGTFMGGMCVGSLALPRIVAPQRP